MGLRLESAKGPVEVLVIDHVEKPSEVSRCRSIFRVCVVIIVPLSDQELLALNRDDLVEMAQKCCDTAVDRRGLDEPQESDAASDDEAGETEASFEDGVDAGWLDEAVCACSFVGDPGGSPASDAVKVLDDAGIPCEVTAVEISSALDRHLAEYEYRMMVPAPLNLKARSIRDKEIFNPQLQADWRLHFQSLTDRELGEPNPSVICAGLVDRINPFEARQQ